MSDTATLQLPTFPTLELAIPTGDQAAARTAKRALDILGALTGLLLVAPLLLLAALAVRLEGGPGVLFRQTRVGQHGHHFTLYKLRSLTPETGEADTRWNIDHDHRLGRVGRLIRATAIDELPQLLNVLRGDMSLVGPRPERPHFVDQFSATIPGYTTRHRVPVGLTGLAVIRGQRGDTSIPARTATDNEYADTWTLLLDLTIIARTALYLIKH